MKLFDWYPIEVSLLAFVRKYIPAPFSNWILHALVGALIGAVGMLLGGVLSACLSAGAAGAFKEYMDYRSGLGQVSPTAFLCTLMGGCLVALVWSLVR